MTAMPALEQLMGAYFHQDWEDDATDDMDVVDQFVLGEPQLAPLLATEIDDLLSTGASEDQLSHLLLDDLGSNYLADWAGGTYRAWLQQIADRVRAAAGTADR